MTTITPADLTAQLRQLQQLAGGGIYDFVLKYGKEFRGAPLPADVEPGEPRLCYSNTWELCFQRPEYTYYEGYGMRPELGIHVMHAWAVDWHGNVVDRTWANPQDCVYVGVPFDNNYVGRHAIEIDAHGILANHWMVPECPLFVYEPVFDDDGVICDAGEA